MLAEFILLVIGAYLLGSVPAAYLVARWSRGIDIRQYGSGNAGAANVSSTVSKRWTIPVTIFDIGKGVLAVYIARWLGLAVYQQVVVGLTIVAGHNWPVFLHFNGGRGWLASAGVIFAFAPRLAVVLAAVAFASAPFGFLATGTLFVITLLPPLSWFASQPFGIERSLSLTLGFTALLAILIIRRLTAPRSGQEVPLRQLLVNRLFFDRDIRDRKAWIYRKPAAASRRQ